MPNWTRRKGKVNATASGKVDELELPRYSSSSLGKMTDVNMEEIVAPKKVHKKSWKVWKKADLY